MKKFIILALAAIFCLAIALPATAEVKVSGLSSMDIYSHYRSQEWKEDEDDGAAGHGVPNAGYVPTQNDERSTQFSTWGPVNYIRFTYENKDQTVGATNRIYMGRRNDAAWTFSNDLNYIWWKPMPDVKVFIGNNSQIIGGPSPGNITGANDLVCCGLFGGNIHGSAKPGITVDIKINDMVTLQIGAYDPDDDEAAALTTLPAVVGGTVDEENSIPRFDIGLPIKYGNFAFKPKASWVLRDFDQVGANSDDEYDVWVVGIDAKFTYGPLTLTGEYALGENLSDANHTGGFGANAKTWNDGPGGVGGYTHIEDNEIDLWWLRLQWKINPKMNAAVYYGEYSHENNVDPRMATDDFVEERSMFGIRLTYNILPNFSVRPAYVMYDGGDNNQWGTATLWDEGQESLIGVGFLLAF